MKKILLAALAMTGLFGCKVPASFPNDCRVAIGVAWFDQPIAVRDRMQRIAHRESRWVPTATNGQHYGCLQIATRVHAARIARLGYTPQDLLRAGPNAEVARDIWNDSGFAPWNF